MNTKLLSEIEQFMAETGMGAYSFGFEAVKNGRLVERLRSGRRIWPETQSAVRAFMRTERSKFATSRPRSPDPSNGQNGRAA